MKYKRALQIVAGLRRAGVKGLKRLKTIAKPRITK